jgi:hypothetical protein
MSKFIAIAVVVAGMTFGLGATANAAGCDHAPVASAQASVPGAYRSYSYQPSAPVTRSYRTYGSYRSYSHQPTYLQGGSKALGRY